MNPDSERLARINTEGAEIAEELFKVLHLRTDQHNMMDPTPTLRALELVCGYILSQLPPNMRQEFAVAFGEGIAQTAEEMSRVEVQVAKEKGRLN